VPSVAPGTDRQAISKPRRGLANLAAMLANARPGGWWPMPGFSPVLAAMETAHMVVRALLNCSAPSPLQAAADQPQDPATAGAIGW